MISEAVQIGGRAVRGFALVDPPDVLPPPFGGRRMYRESFGTSDTGDAWPGDLLAYRQMWEPFIRAHVAIWRYMNSLFEATPAAKNCPAGNFTDAELQGLDPTMRGFCTSLLRTRVLGGSSTDAGSISAQWDAFAGKSNADIVAGAPSMLKWLQDVVKLVSGTYKDELLDIARFWKIDVKLPDAPPIDAQQQIIAKIEGAYVAAKGILELAGYATGTTLRWTATQAAALTEGLTNTVKALPQAINNPWLWVGVVAVAITIGTGLVIYYVPKPAR